MCKASPHAIENTPSWSSVPYLVPDATPRWVEVDAMLAGKAFDGGIPVEIPFRAVLHVVVERKDGLGRVGHACDTQGLKLAEHGVRVVVRHHVGGPDDDEIARAHT